MVSGFLHTGVVVRNLAAMTAYYRDVLGLDVLFNTDADGAFVSQLLGYPNARVRLAFLGKLRDGHCLELVQYLSPVGGDGHAALNAVGTVHLCFSVDDLDATFGELRGRGVRFVNPPATAPDGRLKACAARDPEGNWLEFQERLEERPAASRVTGHPQDEPP